MHGHSNIKLASLSILKIKENYVSIHSSTVSEKNHSSQNYVPLKIQNAPSVRPTEVAI